VIVKGSATILLLGVLLTSGLACGPGGGAEPTPTATPYWRDSYGEESSRLLYAVSLYIKYESDELPVINGGVIIDGEECQILDMVEIWLVEKDYFVNYIWTVPHSCISINGSSNDNCDTSVGFVTFNPQGLCNPDGHYIWAVCEDGYIRSTCVGDDCLANDTDGFQGVYP